MKKWNIATNNFYFTGSVHLEEAPFYIFTIEYITNYVCELIPDIPLPKIKIIRGGEKTNLREYYGCISDIFHVYVHVPISKWCDEKIKITRIEFPYKMLKELFPENFTLIEDNEYLDDFKIKKNKNYSEEVEKEFKIVYKKL